MPVYNRKTELVAYLKRPIVTAAAADFATFTSFVQFWTAGSKSMRHVSSDGCLLVWVFESENKNNVFNWTAMEFNEV